MTYEEVPGLQKYIKYNRKSFVAKVQYLVILKAFQ